MAHDEVFSGPMSESVPSSVISFAHRRSRNDSTVSFTYFQEDDDSLEWREEEAVDVDNELGGIIVDDLNSDLEAAVPPGKSKRTSYSRSSMEDPLLSRHESTNSYMIRKKAGGRVNQKIYIVTEDLTAVIAGFSTSVSGLAIYVILCVLSLGSAYLLLRWLPKWRVRLIGTPAPLRKCEWVAIEDQWSQFMIHRVSTQTYGRPLSTVFGTSSLDNVHSDNDEDNDPPLALLRFVDYRYLRFIYNPLEDKFQLVNGWKDPSWTNVKLMRSGLDVDERDSRERVFGRNLIDVHQKSMFQLLVDEVLHPFYIFQIASLVLWSLDEYYYYAVCIFVISVFSIGATVMETRSTMSRLREISHFECNVRVLRNGFWRTVPSREMVPGDVFEVSDPSLSQVPCDCLLLSGDCIINESMLTGESVPVSKVPVTDDALDYLDLKAPSIHPNVAKHFLFCGTKIIRARRPQDADDEAVALAVVVRTGFSTTKGSLVRSMLFPKPSGFKFYRDSFRYISVMGVIAALGFIASFVNFIRLGLSWRVVIVRALDLVTIVVPPALPATLTIGTNFALSRLKKQQIFCISPQRFTEMFSEASHMFSTPQLRRDSYVDYNKCKRIIYTMATCHSLRLVDGELLGDPLDIKMFEFTGWTYEEGGSANSDQSSGKGDTIIPSVARPPAMGYGHNELQNDEVGFPLTLTTPDIVSLPPFAGSFQIRMELGILRSFEFVSHLRRTSVIVRQFGDNGASVFVKGAPELPYDFDELLSHYTHRGYRVIACAAKYESKLSWMKVQKMSREEAESNLEFLGFIIFENKLKQTTTHVIDELKRAGIRNVMCTGDNILTAISVARECGLIDPYAHCFVPRFVGSQGLDATATLVWESVNDPNARLDETTLMPVTTAESPDISVPLNNLNMHTYSIAVSGDVFRWLIDYGNEEVLRRTLVKGQVFARMSPDEKHELVEKLQSLDYCCGFCGDGANDCGALKAADVGISLSDAEASVAAPFTSRIFDISCVPKLIKEGRAALVTSFCCFKYMSLYSAIQFTTVSFLYTSASNLGDFQYLFIDLALILPIAIFMGWNGPYPLLSRKRPTADLVSRKVLTPLLGQIAIHVLMQLVVFKIVQTRPWFQPPRVDLKDANIENSENTSLFLVSCYQYIFSSVVLSVGPPFRRPIFSNIPFLVTLASDLLLSTYMLFKPSKWLMHIMQLTKMSGGFKAFLFTLAILGFVVSWIAEHRIFPTFARVLGRAYVRLRPNRGKRRRRYKVLLEEMQT
ncbi:Calcium-transporting ATPase [Rasamsonia emersonii CBS 393.64]|uniref:Cation-transporting ATPase n=1 Tax=Rasamsonia emersonii (strain ATCC 16479 / CBS 393.64 / IMI 116815) TaxID=1408163 RepID=A0A0F4YVI0_RASE3|nr:Calcium-transporting ATPase [Rasamsonia emersonii CBS 393.64]KKA21856.1 Calcium-transporting ATPase [Rasamsonia emersonii CBS 393.64]